MTDTSFRPLHAGFVETARTAPDRAAVERGGEILTYGALHDLAARIGALVAEGGPAELSAVIGNRSIAGYAGLLGILYAGQGYVPAHPTFPAGRIADMLMRTRVRSVVVDEAAVKRLPDLLPSLPALHVIAPTVEIGHLAQAFPAHRFSGPSDIRAAVPIDPQRTRPDQTALVLFTSGSTGVPKGVVVLQRNVRRYIDYAVEVWDFRETDRFGQLHELTFDMHVMDLFCAWERGGVVVAPSGAASMFPARYAADARITVWNSVPSTAALMRRSRTLPPGIFPALRYAFFCGEVLPADIAADMQQAAPGAAVENIYGPTEATLIFTRYRWDPATSPAEAGDRQVVPIGTPFPGMDVMLLGPDGEPVPDGEVGELVVAGPLVTGGYWEDPERTAAAFVRLPGSDVIWYRTGDRVRRLPSGALCVLGRSDHQLQVRGFRVELGEVEAALRRASAASLVAVVGEGVRHGRADDLVAFVSSDEPDPRALRKRLLDEIPAYMVPREIRRIDPFPRNANGKVDRTALAALLEPGGE